MRIELNGQYRLHKIDERLELISEQGEYVFVNGEHYQDCCEQVYADFDHLKDTGFENQVFDYIEIEFVEDFGFKLNGYPVACYDNQNGYYSSDLEVLVTDGKGNKMLLVDIPYESIQHNHNW